MEFKFEKTLVSETELKQIEDLCGYAIPAELRNIILAHNGAAILFKNLALDSLISFSASDEGNVYTVMSFLKENRVENLLPFATDENGDLFCLRKKDANSTPEVALLRVKFFMICTLFSSFSEFLTSLENG